MLLLEMLQVAQRRRWSEHAAALVKQRAFQHFQVLTRALVAARREGGHSTDGQSEILEKAQAAAARQWETVDCFFAASGETSSSLVGARRLLDDFDVSLNGLAEIERSRLDHSIEVRHRRFVLSGTNEVGETSEIEQSMQSVVADANPAPLHPHALAGLALSGGGIRSASFALGALQSMSRAALLPAFEFVSTVSGGGYASSWFAAWSYRHRGGIHGVERELFRSLNSDCGPLHWLRRHSSYLAPRPNIASSDVWALVVAYITNWLPVLLLVVMALITLLLAPYALSLAAGAIAESSRRTPQSLMVLIALLGLVLYMGLVRRLTLYYREPGQIPRHPDGLAATIFWGAVGLTLLMSTAMPVAAEILMTRGWRLGYRWPFDTEAALEPMASIFGFWASASLLSWPVAKFFASPQTQRALDAIRGWWLQMVPSGPLKRNRMPASRVVMSMFMGSVVASAILAVLLPYFRMFVDHAWALIAIGPLLLMSTMAASELVALLAVARFQRDVDRAWAARVGSWMLSGVLAWTALSLLSLGGDLLWFDHERSVYRLPLLAATTLPIFLVTYFWTLRNLGRGAALAVAAGLTGLLLLVQFAVALLTHHIHSWGVGIWHVSAGMLVLATCVVLLSRLIDVNRFSLHSIYMEGLVRTFLGASRLDAKNPNVEPPSTGTPAGQKKQFATRRPDPVTNTDDDDNPLLIWLKSQPTRELPVLLMNAAVNGSSNADQEGRFPRQWPFTFSQYFSGSPAGGVGYAPTDAFFTDSDRGGLTLGEAMAVSGAAMSPTSGYRTHPVKAFLFGLLNARLGLWIGNPSDPASRRRSRPPLGGLTVLREMLGHRAAFGSWIHLSDGGHFENLGIYELLRRGCLRIVAIDASCDPHRHFDDLANAIRRARIDLAVHITHVGPWDIRGPDGGQADLAADSSLAEAAKDTSPSAHRSRAWTWFDVDYGRGLPRGRLLYIKPSVYRGESLPIEVQNYWDQQSAFPHESTADQFFSERQMEAYRALGELCTLDAMRVVGVTSRAGGDDVPADTELLRMVKRSLQSVPTRPKRPEEQAASSR